MDVSQADHEGAPTPGAAPFTRKATGLVRELSLVDMISYNAAVATPLGVALAIARFYVWAALPVANLTIALVIGLIGIIFPIVTFALLSSAMPRIGGGYASFLLHYH